MQMKLRSPEGSYSAPVGAQEPKTAQRKPVLIIALGRGRVGKTVFLNSVAQFYRPRGARLEIWNIDQHNNMHSLNQFFPDVRVPPGFQPLSCQRWLEEQIQDQQAKGYDVVLDVGGNDTMIKKLALDADLAATLEMSGIRPVGVHVIGPDPADLEYLRQVANNKLFVPEATLIVLNAGLVPEGLSAEPAFEHVFSDPSVMSAIRAGGCAVLMPGLETMQSVVDRGMTFSEAVSMGYKIAENPLRMFDRARTRKWWDEKMPDFFSKIPGPWMPNIPESGE
jgi:hypothetical protein